MYHPEEDPEAKQTPTVSRLRRFCDFAGCAVVGAGGADVFYLSIATKFFGKGAPIAGGAGAAALGLAIAEAAVLYRETKNNSTENSDSLNRSWFRVNIHGSEVRLVRGEANTKQITVGFIALSETSKSALEDAASNCADLMPRVEFDLADTTHEVFPLCDDDAGIAEQIAYTTWPPDRGISFVDFRET
jgi:hypothetical protein